MLNSNLKGVEMVPRVIRNESEVRIVGAHEGIVWPVLVTRTPADLQEPLLISCMADPEFRLCAWSVTTGSLVWALPTGSLSDGCFGLAVAHMADGTGILAAATGEGIARWDVRNGSPLRAPSEEPCRAIWDVDAYALKNGRVLFVGAGNDHLVYRWDAVTGAAVGEPLAGHYSSVKCVSAIDVPGRGVVIFSAGDDGYIQRWDGETGDSLGGWEVSGPELMFLDVIATRSGTVILSCVDTEGMLYRYDGVSGALLGDPVEVEEERVTSLCSVEIKSSPYLLTACESGVVRRWDAVTGSLLDDAAAGISADSVRDSSGRSLVGYGTMDGDIIIRKL